MRRTPFFQVTRLTRALLTSCALSLGVMGFTLPPAHATSMASATQMPAGVAWREAQSEADVEQAFALARYDHKPVLLYWGASWCPPCNQLKATLFKRQDFIAQSRAVVAVHLDGDHPGAQKLGARFKVTGYPTLILFNPDAKELTRLPGEADARQVMQVLQLGMAGGRPVAEVLADAKAGKRLSANEWRLLAFYGWDTDEQQLVAKAQRATLLMQLAQASQSVDADASMRLWLKALSTEDAASSFKPGAADRARLQALLADGTANRTQIDVLSNFSAEIVKALAPQAGANRLALLTPFDATLRRFQADTSFSTADRLQALCARIDLARVDLAKTELHPKLDARLQQEVKTYAATLDHEVTDGYERQAVIGTAASALSDVGLWDDSDQLLKTSLAKSHSPYYLMSHLGSNALKQGHKDEALHWYEQAFSNAEGPATRLQWGSNYLKVLVDLAPQDEARIEKTTQQVFAEAAQDSGAFYERSARSLKLISTKLLAWNAKGQHDAALGRLKNQLNGICSKLPAGDAQKSTCESLLKPGQV